LVEDSIAILWLRWTVVALIEFAVDTFLRVKQKEKKQKGYVSVERRRDPH
jgi:hypothetical protein